MTTIRSSALAIYRTGRLQLLHVSCSWDFDSIIARVRSSREDGPDYAIEYSRRLWTCTCRLGTGCAHILATQMATGNAPRVAS